MNTIPKLHTAACKTRIEEAMAVDEIGRARLAETLWRNDKRREPDDPETEITGVRRRIEKGAFYPSGHRAADVESVPVTMPIDVPAVVNMGDSMNIEALLERQFGELSVLVAALGQTETHVAEIFRPGRFTVRARRLDFRPGTAMDLRTGYDFNKEPDRMRARECLFEGKPLLLVGSPRCAEFSQLQNLSKDCDRWRALAREGMQHLTFVCELHKKQIDGERFFLHRHPAHARCWGLWMIREILDMPCVVRVVGDLCPFGLWCTDVEGLALVRKPTGWMTNSMKVAKALDRRCSRGHRHCNIFCGGAHKMRIIERHPVRLVNAVLKALRQEVEKWYQLAALEAGQHVDEPGYEEIYDAIIGVKLDLVLVAKARNTEMRFLVDELNAYKYDSVDNCLRMTGKRPIPVKCVDVNKGDAQRPEVRSRLAVLETKHRTTLSEEDNAQTFSATLPYEALRLLVSFVMSPRNKDEKSHALMFIDVTRAHPHCTMRRQTWVELPAEDPRSKEESVCGLLLRSIHGLRDAGMNSEMLTRQVMDKLDFNCGLWTPCVFVHREKNMQAYVHGINFVIKGVRRELYDFFSNI